MAIGTATALALGSVGSAVIGGNASKKAAGAASAAADADRALQERMYEETTGRFQPFYQGGQDAFSAFMSEMGLGEAPEGYGGYEASPMANYLLTKGTESIDASAAARGTLNSGATLEALENNRQNVIGADMDNYYARLMGLAGMGSNAAGNMGAAGANFASGAGNAGRYAANAAGQAAYGQAGAIQGGIQDLAGIYGYFNPMEAYGQSTMAAGQAPQSSPRPMARPF